MQRKERSYFSPRQVAASERHWLIQARRVVLSALTVSTATVPQEETNEDKESDGGNDDSYDYGRVLAWG